MQKCPQTSILGTSMGFMGPTLQLYPTDPMKNSTLIHKNVQKYLLLVLWAQTPICMGPINLKMGLSSNVCLRSNRFNGKKMTKYPKILFLSTFMGFMAPKSHFYGSHKPQVMSALDLTDPMKNGIFMYQNDPKYLKTPFLSTFMGF